MAGGKDGGVNPYTPEQLKWLAEQDAINKAAAPAPAYTPAPVAAPAPQFNAEELAFLQWANENPTEAAKIEQPAPSMGGGLGESSNDEYRAAKLAQDAAAQAEQDWYKSVSGTNDDPFRYNSSQNEDTAFYYDKDGNFGLGIRPENLYYNDALGAMVEGTAGVPASQGSELSLGGGVAAPARDAVAGDDIFSNPFPDASGGNGLPNGGIPQDYLPDSNGNDYWDYQPQGGPVNNTWGVRDGVSGVGVQAGGPNSVGKNPPTGTGDPFSQGPGSGPTPIDWQGLDDSLRPELTGYESSSNKDFYQKQFQDMRTQQAGDKTQKFYADVIRGTQAPQANTLEQGGNWDWADLPEVSVGGGLQGSDTPQTWGPNSGLGITKGMTNQQVVGQMGQLLNSDEASMMAEHFRNNPDTAAGTRWSTAGNPQALLGAMGTNSNLSPEFGNVLQKVFNNTYTSSGGTNSGMNVPEGYAAPT